MKKILLASVLSSVFFGVSLTSQAQQGSRDSGSVIKVEDTLVQLEEFCSFIPPHQSYTSELLLRLFSFDLNSKVSQQLQMGGGTSLVRQGEQEQLKEFILFRCIAYLESASRRCEADDRMPNEQDSQFCFVVDQRLQIFELINSWQQLAQRQIAEKRNTRASGTGQGEAVGDLDLGVFLSFVQEITDGEFEFADFEQFKKQREGVRFSVGKVDELRQDSSSSWDDIGIKLNVVIPLGVRR